jgi:tRNA (guanosine-2'-O-)-methyltransferase
VTSSGVDAPRAQWALPPGVPLVRSCVPTGPEICFNATDDNCNGIVDEGCGLNTGIVQFVIAWNESDADVDLEVTDPSGVLVEVGRTTPSGLTKNQDCPSNRDACRNQNVEDVYLTEGEPPRGTYRVVVRLTKLGGENPPIHVRLGARVGPHSYGFELTLDKPDAERELRLTL